MSYLSYYYILGHYTREITLMGDTKQQTKTIKEKIISKANYDRHILANANTR